MHKRRNVTMRNKNSTEDGTHYRVLVTISDDNINDTTRKRQRDIFIDILKAAKKKKKKKKKRKEIFQIKITSEEIVRLHLYNLRVILEIVIYRFHATPVYLNNLHPCEYTIYDIHAYPNVVIYTHGGNRGRQTLRNICR